MLRKGPWGSGTLTNAIEALVYADAQLTTWHLSLNLDAPTCRRVCDRCCVLPRAVSAVGMYPRQPLNDEYDIAGWASDTGRVTTTPTHDDRSLNRGFRRLYGMGGTLGLGGKIIK